jgi:hypothetical protein
LARRERQGALAKLPLDPSVDISNLHYYARGGPPEDGLTGFVTRARKVAPGKPLYITEAGFHTAVKQSGRQAGVSEVAQGPYVLRNLLANAGAGVARTYLYELLDERPEPGLEDQEQHFGLLRNDFSAKPAYNQLRQLLHAVADPGQGGAAPVPLAISVPDEVDGQGIGHLLLARRDGSYQLALWRTGSLYGDHHDIKHGVSVDVSLGAPHRVGYTAFTGTDAPPEDLGTAQHIVGHLGNDVVLLDLTAPAPGATAAPGGVSFTEPPSSVPETTASGVSWEVVAIAVVVGAGLVLLAVLLVRARLRRRRRPPVPGRTRP